MDDNELMYRNGAMPERPSRGRGIGTMFSDFDSLFDGMDHSRVYNLAERKGHCVASVDMPGVRKDDIQINLEENMLTVKARRESDNDTRSYNTSFMLPNNIDNEAEIKAVYEDGVLKIAIPKSKNERKKSISLSDKDDGFFNKLFSKEDSEINVNN